MNEAPHPPSYRALSDRLGLTAELGHDRDWSAAPDFLGLIAGHVLAEWPETIVECSSGTSTVVLARCCQLNGRGRVYSLENGAEFAARTRAELARHGLEPYARVVDAPLAAQDVAGSEFRWYDLAGLPDVAIDMLVVDGPPGFIQARARYPALPLLASRLAAACTIFLDDAARPDEVEIVEAWCREFPDARRHYVETERGCAILRLHRAQG